MYQNMCHVSNIYKSMKQKKNMKSSDQIYI